MFVGTTSFVLANFLMLRPTYVMNTQSAIAEALPAGLHNADGTPAFMGFLAYFAALFLVLRWWKQSDPLRRVRLSVWSTFVAVVVAIAIHSICPFPRGFIIAATMALAVQLSGTWVDRDGRRRLEKHVANAEI